MRSSDGVRPEKGTWGAGLRVAAGPALLLMVATVLAVPTAAAAAIVPDTFTTIKAAHSDKCLNVPNASVDNNVQIIQYTCGPTYVNDKWRVEPKGAGTYWIRSTSSNKCLNVKGNLLTDNTPIIQYTCTDGPQNTLWKFQPVGRMSTYRIVSVSSGKCLNISRALLTDKAPLVQYACQTVETVLNDQFYLPPTASATPLDLAMTRHQPIVAVQGASGGSVLAPITYSYIDNLGYLRIGYQKDPDSPFTVTWSTVEGGFSYVGPPQVALLSDGRVQLVTHESKTGDVWLQDQTEKGAGSFGAIQDVGGAISAQPAVGRSPDDKHLVVFAVVDGGLWHLPEDVTNANTPYGGWRYIGGTGLVGTPKVVTLDDRIQVFVRNGSGALLTASYQGGRLADLTDLGGSGLTGTPSVVVYPGFWERVFVTSADGTIITKRQNTNGTWAAEWTTVGDFAAAAGSPSAILDPDKGRTGIVVRGTDSEIHFVYETGQLTGEWGAWKEVTAIGTETDPTAFSFSGTRANGTTGAKWGFTVRSADEDPQIFTANNLDDAAGLRATGTSLFTRHALPLPKK